MSAEAFPLSWPQGYERTRYRKRAAFKTGFASARDGLISELRLMRVSYVVISTNIPLRRDGLPYSGQAQPSDPGVAVYFLWKEKQRVLACDRWDRVEDNLHAVELAVQAMRGLERWGVSQILDRAFEGFTALPPPSQTGSQPWHEVLGVDPRDTLDVIETMFKAKIRKAHPDLGGSTEEAQRINAAMAAARKAKG